MNSKKKYLQSQSYDTPRVKILKLDRFETQCQKSNQDTQESSKQSFGKLGEFHLEKDLNFISFSPQNYTKDEDIFYTITLRIVGVDAKDQIRVWLKFGATLFV